MFRHGHVNDDEIGEYSRSSSDVLNCNSKQKKKRYTFFTFLQSDFKLIELSTYYLVLVQILKKMKGISLHKVHKLVFAFPVYFLIKQINFHHKLLQFQFEKLKGLMLRSNLNKSLST